MKEKRVAADADNRSGGSGNGTCEYRKRDKTHFVVNMAIAQKFFVFWPSLTLVIVFNHLEKWGGVRRIRRMLSVEFDGFTTIVSRCDYDIKPSAAHVS